MGSHYVFEKSLLELGAADECEHMVAKRMDEVNSTLETCSFRQHANLPRTVENPKFSRKKTGISDTSFPPLSGHRVSCHALEVDQRIWATNRAWRGLYGMWWDKKVPYNIKRTLFRGAVCGASLTGLTALLLHDRDYLQLQRCLEKKLRALMLGTASWERLSALAKCGEGGDWCLLHTSSVYKGSGNTRSIAREPARHAVGLAERTSNPTTHSLRAFVWVNVGRWHKERMENQREWQPWWSQINASGHMPTLRLHPST